MTRIVGIHGVGNDHPGLSPQEAATDIAAAWTQALEKHLSKPVDVRIGYYAHLLRKEPIQGDIEDLALSPFGEAALVAWARSLGLSPEPSQGRPTQPLRQIIEWIATRYGLDNRLVSWFVGTFLAEVETYLEGGQGSVRQSVVAAVTESIAQASPDVVIAHSLGSVVAYEALNTLPVESVGLFLTIGSPLAMPDVIFERVVADVGRPAQRPASVRRWINVADVGDPVAVPHRLGGHYRVDEDLPEKIGLFDFHRVRKYLASRTVTGIVAATG